MIIVWYLHIASTWRAVEHACDSSCHTNLKPGIPTSHRAFDRRCWHSRTKGMWPHYDISPQLAPQTWKLICVCVCVWNIWSDVKLWRWRIIYYNFLKKYKSRGSPGSRGGPRSTKTPPRDPCKRTCCALVVHLGAFKSQLVAAKAHVYIHMYIYFYIYTYIHPV